MNNEGFIMNRNHELIIGFSEPFSYSSSSNNKRYRHEPIVAVDDEKENQAPDLGDDYQTP